MMTDPKPSPLGPGQQPDLTASDPYRLLGVLPTATHTRLTPHEIAEACERLADLDMLPTPHDEGSEAQPVTDEETQALLKRAQMLLDEGSLAEDQAAELTGLMQDIAEAETQDELDELAEELLDLLFELEYN